MHSAANQDFETHALSPRIGTKVTLDKGQLLAGKYSSQILALIEERGTLLLPRVNMTDSEQLSFTTTLGQGSRI